MQYTDLSLTRDDSDTQTLHEQDIKETDELLYAKRYFFSDDFVDKDDPFSLHLLYVTAQKAVVSGHYQMTHNGTLFARCPLAALTARRRCP